MKAINMALIVSRKKLKFKKIDLSQIATEIANKYQETTDKELIFNIQKDVFGFGDLGLVKIVLENLINNSIKFSSKTSKTIIEFGSFEKENNTIFYIKDNGIGFDMKFANKLFTPFQRLHSQSDYEGIGIGLATIQRIINRHQGKIWGEGEENKGATFYFTLAKIPD